MFSVQSARPMTLMTPITLTTSEAQIKPEELTRLRTRLLPPFKVVLFDDDYNEMNYVIFALQHAVNNLTVQEAENIMLTAHLTGSAVVVVCPKETAEYYQERLLSYGLTATILFFLQIIPPPTSILENLWNCAYMFLVLISRRNEAP